MENPKHLKDETYYSELYDRTTVRQCRFYEDDADAKIKSIVENGTDEDKLENIRKKWIHNVVVPIAIYFITAERYANKAKTIKDWMENDRLRDEKFDNTNPPEHVYCLNCGSYDLELKHKDAHEDFEDYTKDRFSFMFECVKCNRPSIFWENGDKWDPKTPCKKCGYKSTEETYKREGSIITTLYECKYCGHKETSVWDLSKKIKREQEKIDYNFEKDRERFCLSKEEGDKAAEGAMTWKYQSQRIEDLIAQEDVKKKISDIKKLNIAELLNILEPAVEKGDYIKLDLSKPEVGRNLIVNFTIQDNKTDREAPYSTANLEKIFKANLAGTNWRLMNSEVSYRLGVLSGRLRGYETDEDLLRLK